MIEKVRSPPMRGRELKPSPSPRGTKIWTSPPMRGRELKPQRS